MSAAWENPEFTYLHWLEKSEAKVRERLASPGDMGKYAIREMQHRARAYADARKFVQRDQSYRAQMSRIMEIADRAMERGQMPPSVCLAIREIAKGKQ